MKQIKTSSGIVTGKKTDYGYEFLGIPYAQAVRFMPPTQSEWSGILECTKYSLKACQCTDDPDKCSEDCLSLNIYTPDIYGLYPVVIDIHGGGFQSGSNSGNYSHPERFVHDKRCIYIPIQYRLGIWGYLDLSKELGDEYASSGNCGTLDQLAAIRWVSDNIEKFGGDPNRITLMGNSAGAKSIGALLTIPESKGLFDKFITLSGSSQCIRTPETAQIITGRFLKILDCKAKDLLNMSNDILIKAQMKLTENFATCMFGPVSDGIVIPKDWRNFIRSDKAWRGSAYIGSNRHENGNLVREVPDFLSRINDIINGLFGDNSHYATKAYEELTEGQTLSDDEKTGVWVKVISDFMYRTHSDRLASIFAKRKMNVWEYSFEWLPAYHDADRRFAWYELNWKNEGIPEEKITAAIKLSNQIYESFISFIMNGNPNCDVLPYLNPVTETCLSKWLFNDTTIVKKWSIGEYDAIPTFPDDVYYLSEEKYY